MHDEYKNSSLHSLLSVYFAACPPSIHNWPYYVVKPGQNKKGQKNFQLHCFLTPFLQLAAEKKDSKTVQLEFFLAHLIL